MRPPALLVYASPFGPPRGGARARDGASVRALERRGPPPRSGENKIAVEGSFLGSPPGSDAVRPSYFRAMSSRKNESKAARSTRASTAAHRSPAGGGDAKPSPARRSAEDSEDPGSRGARSPATTGNNDLPRSREFAEARGSPRHRRGSLRTRASFAHATRASLADASAGSNSAKRASPPLRSRSALFATTSAGTGRPPKPRRTWGSGDGALWVAVGFQSQWSGVGVAKVAFAATSRAHRSSPRAARGRVRSWTRRTPSRSR